MRPIDLIVIHHSASLAGAHTWEDIRRWHLAKGWADIGYHWGVVFDGDGWTVKPGRVEEDAGAHAKGFNQRSIGVCFEGNYDVDQLPAPAFDFGVELVWEICKRHGLVHKFGPPPVHTTSAAWFVKGHRELPYATACPGRHFPINRLRGVIADRLYQAREHDAAD